jgi:formate--tetrahydrofolate ligase
VKLKDVDKENVEAVAGGFENLLRHAENLRLFGIPFVVALNRFPTDTAREVERFLDLCSGQKLRAVLSSVWAEGGAGGEALAREVLTAMEQDPNRFQFLYPAESPLVEKIETVAKKVYGAAGIAMEGKTRRALARFEKMGFRHLPVCIAKTQYSLSADEEALGRPLDFTLIVTDVSLSTGAGFVVVFCGDIMTIPGLPKTPAAEGVDVTDAGIITGLD